MRFISNLCFVLGGMCVLYSGLLLLQRYNPSRVAFQNYEKDNAPKLISTKRPTRLRIPSAQIETPIILADHPTDRWEVSNEGVSYLTSSPLPGNRGNSIIYGHNWPTILGNLTKVRPGDILEVNYSDNSVRKFVVTATGVVTPDQTHILKNTNDARITIYTCTGFFDSKRLVITAAFLDSVSIDKSRFSVSYSL